MKRNNDRSRKDLLDEISMVRQRIAELEKYEAGRRPTAEALEGAAGRLNRIVNAAMDVTERECAPQALKRSETTLKSVYSVAPSALWSRTAGGWGWVNDAMVSISGYSPEEQREVGARGFYLSGEEYDRVGGVVTEGIKGCGIGITDTKWVRKDGELRDIHLRGAAIDPSDISSGLVFVAVDITDAKRSEKALESEAKYRMVVETPLWAYPLFRMALSGSPIKGGAIFMDMVAMK
jgi:PAS domain S-box-containing protein